MVPPRIQLARAMADEFPSSDPEWEMGRTEDHVLFCKLLRDILRIAAGLESASVGADQFVYFDPRNPRRKCAPDGFVKLGVPHQRIRSWKTWERGVPELCVEILSTSDHEKLTLEEKLERFQAMGTGEVVAFDMEAPAGRRVRAWDRVRAGLVERRVRGERTRCRTLGLWFVVAPAPLDELPEGALRLAEDPRGERLVATPLEREDAARSEAVAEIERLRAELARARRR